MHALFQYRRYFVFVILALTLAGLIYFWQQVNSYQHPTPQLISLAGIKKLFEVAKEKYFVRSVNLGNLVIKVVDGKSKVKRTEEISISASVDLNKPKRFAEFNHEEKLSTLKKSLKQLQSTVSRNFTHLPSTIGSFLSKANDIIDIRNGSIKNEATKACDIPKLNPFAEVAMKYIEEDQTLKCDREDHGILHNGTLKLKAQGVRAVLVRYIRRVEDDDFSIELSPPIGFFTQEEDPRIVKPGMVGCFVNSNSKFMGVKRRKHAIELSETDDCFPDSFIRILEDGKLQDFALGDCLIMPDSIDEEIETEDCGQIESKFQVYKNGVMKDLEQDQCLLSSENKMILGSCKGRLQKKWLFQDFPCKKDIDTEIQVTEDFVDVQIATMDSVINEEYAEVRPKLRNTSPNERKPGLPYNVALLMFDSLSAANTERKLKRVFNYITEDENSVVLKGHTINGDGTTAQLSALLVDETEENLPEARREKPGSDTVDRWPFIFSNFSDRGYYTMFGEDDSLFGSFHYRLKGFKRQPTNHYPRPFWSRMPRSLYSHYCMGSKMIHQVGLNYIMSFLEAYRNKPTFSLTCFSQLFHNNMNRIELADQDITDFLTEFKRKGIFENTILILFGDHGLRASGFRGTTQGKLEERLPLMALMLPPTLIKAHPEFFSAIKHNSQLLTTHFDTHATLKHLLTYPNEPVTKYGQSLFTKIDPGNRTCLNAGIKDHWCPCLKFSNVDITNKRVVEAANVAVRYINENIIEKFNGASEKCEKLKLSTIKRAGSFVPKEAVQNFVRTVKNDLCDECGVVNEKRASERPQMVDYEIVFNVEPSGGMFEAKVTWNKDEWIVDKDISRLNIYGSQPKCIQDQYPALRKFCMCK